PVRRLRPLPVRVLPGRGAPLRCALETRGDFVEDRLGGRFAQHPSERLPVDLDAGGHRDLTSVACTKLTAWSSGLCADHGSPNTSHVAPSHTTEAWAEITVPGGK